MIKKLLIAILLFTSTALAQTPVALMPQPHPQFFLPNGTPNAGGCLFFYNAGTSIQAATYVDSTGLILNSNPVILDSSGYTTVYLSNQSYKVVEFSTGGVNCASGLQIWSQDNVNAYQIVSGVTSIIFAGVTSDPAGQAGMVIYRSDLGRLRVFNSAWDTIPTDNSVDSLTNKSIEVNSNTLTCTPGTNGQYLRNNGARILCSAILPADTPPYLNSQFVNSTTRGTVANQLVSLATAGVSSVAQQALLTDTGGVVGICISGCSNSGNSQIAIEGQVQCFFDGPTTSGDFIQTSTTTAGTCHDVGGGGYPSSGQVIGRAMATQALSNVLVPIDLFSSDIRAPSASATFPNVVYSAPSASTNANIVATTMATPAANATYRFSIYFSVSAVGVGCTGATVTTVNPSLTWTDPLGAAPFTSVSLNHNLTVSGTPNGTLGPSMNYAVDVLFYARTASFRAKAGTAIQYQVTYAIGSGCGPGPQYTAFPLLEQLTAN